MLIASAFFAGATLDLDPAQIAIHFKTLPGSQRFALAAILFTALSLIGSSVWQTYSLARQNRFLRDRLKGLRQETLVAHGSQKELDAVVQHLVDRDPEEAIASLHETLTDTEQRAALQRSRGESVDMQDRLDVVNRPFGRRSARCRKSGGRSNRYLANSRIGCGSSTGGSRSSRSTTRKTTLPIASRSSIITYPRFKPGKA